ncbi:MAG: serine hydrolase [Acidobacteria bacterium]|nr:serine hydrolase [Acidobacteriota bacterium]
MLTLLFLACLLQSQTDWWVSGPYLIGEAEALRPDGALHKARLVELPDEQVVSLPFQPQSPTWRQFRVAGTTVDLTQVMETQASAIGLAVQVIEKERAEKVVFEVGSDDGIAIWINGEPVYSYGGIRRLNQDEDCFQATLKKGPNLVLVKVLNQSGLWGFSLKELAPRNYADRAVLAALRGDLETCSLFQTLNVPVDQKGQWGISPIEAATLARARAVVDLYAPTKASEPIDPTPFIQHWLAEKIDNQGPGLSVLVARGDSVLLNEGLGLANRNAQRPIRPDTQFRIGSLTKQFTAVAILQLVEAGKLQLTDALETFFPGFPSGNEITVHHLLAHTSGLINYTDDLDFEDMVTQNISAPELIERIKSKPLQFEPGQRFAYCNSGYFLLGAILEKVSGESYADYLANHLFKPLGMASTFAWPKQGDPSKTAMGYAWNEPNSYVVPGMVEPAPVWDLAWAGGAGNMVSTTGDLLQWYRGLRDNTLLKKETLAKAWTPYPSESDPNNAYGYGWFISRQQGLTCIEHTGGLAGFLTYAGYWPQADLTVVVLTNALPGPPELNPAPLGQRLAAMYQYAHLPWQDPAPKPEKTHSSEELQEYVGRFDYGTAVMVFSVEDGQLYAQLTRQPRFPIYAVGKDRFAWKVVKAEVQFVRNGEGKVVRVIHNQSGRSFEANKLVERTSIELSPQEMEAVTGDYNYGGAIMKIRLVDGHLSAQLGNQPAFRILPAERWVFYWEDIPAEITFVADEKGSVIKAIHRQAGQSFEAPKIQ